MERIFLPSQCCNKVYFNIKEIVKFSYDKVEKKDVEQDIQTEVQSIKV